MSKLVAFISGAVISGIALREYYWGHLNPNNYGFREGEITKFIENFTTIYMPTISMGKVVNLTMLAIGIIPLWLSISRLKSYNSLFIVIPVYMISWSIFGGIGFLWYKGNGNLLGSFLARESILAMLSAAAILLSVYLVKTASSFTGHVYDQRYPDAALAMCLLDLVYQLEQPNAVWQDLQWRVYVLNLLGRTAVLVRKYLFRSLRVSDPTIQKWQDERIKVIAAALLEKQRWLITPMPITKEMLRPRVTGMLLAALRGEWDSFEVSTAETATRVERVRLAVNMRQFLQKLLAAFSPLILVISVRKYALVDLDPSLNSYLHLGSMLWAAVSLLYLLDPRPDEKVSTIKNIISVTRSGDKKAAAD